MILRVTLCNGQRYYLDESDTISCIRNDVSGHEDVPVLNSIGRFVSWKKDVQTDNSLTEINGIKLNFKTGHALGIMLPRVYPSPTLKTTIAFRCCETEDLFMDVFEDMLTFHRRLRYGGTIIGRRDEYLYKAEIIASDLLHTVYFFLKGDLSWRSKVPYEFKEGLLIGMFDAYGSIQIQKRPKYLNGKPAINFMIDTTLYKIHYLAQRLIHGIDIEASESFSYSGHNNNRTVFRMEYVRKYIGLFRKCVNKNILRNLDSIQELSDNSKYSTVKVPITQEKLNKVVKGKKISYFLNSGTPAINRLELESYVKINPDRRWDQIKSLDIHEGEKF